MSKSGAVLFAKNPERVAHFYAGVADMQVTHSGKDVIVLESSGHQLVVHPIPARIARTLKITVPPQRRTHAAVKLVFAVKSIALARALAASLGGELDPPERMFEARGCRACDGHDPEGNVVQMREPAAAPQSRPVRKGSAKVGVDYETLRRLALALPGVTDSSTLRGMSFKVRGKLLACKAIHRSALPESFVVRMDSAERDRLIAREPALYYVTPHYLASDVVLVRMANIDEAALQTLFMRALQCVTGKAKARKRG